MFAPVNHLLFIHDQGRLYMRVPHGMLSFQQSPPKWYSLFLLYLLELFIENAAYRSSSVTLIVGEIAQETTVT
jgi:hypothetical protein